MSKGSSSIHYPEVIGSLPLNVFPTYVAAHLTHVDASAAPSSSWKAYLIRRFREPQRFEIEFRIRTGSVSGTPIAAIRFFLAVALGDVKRQRMHALEQQPFDCEKNDVLFPLL